MDAVIHTLRREMMSSYLHTVPQEEVELYRNGCVGLPTAVCGTPITDAEQADTPEAPRCPACVETRPDLEPDLDDPYAPAIGYVYDSRVQMTEPKGLRRWLTWL